MPKSGRAPGSLLANSPLDKQDGIYEVSFLADDIILLRYVELAGQLRKSLTVVKMRNSAHSAALRLYEITAQGLVVRDSLQDYRGIGSGMAELRDGIRPPRYPGLTDQELVVLQALIELREATVGALAQRSGLPEGPPLSAALDRLVRLNYAIPLDAGGGVCYRPVA
jgi:hypothetical protein